MVYKHRQGGIDMLIGVQDIYYYVMIALALGLDAFSVSLGMGMQFLRLKKIALIGFVIGIFHTVLPLVGLLFGQVLIDKIGQLADVVAGFILVFLGAFMFYSTFKQENFVLGKFNTIKWLSIAFIVSIDSFPVGLSLGIYGIHTIFVVLLFGCVSMILSWLGMLIGRKTYTLLQVYSEILGGIILFCLGLYLIF